MESKYLRFCCLLLSLALMLHWIPAQAGAVGVAGFSESVADPFTQPEPESGEEDGEESLLSTLLYSMIRSMLRIVWRTATNLAEHLPLSVQPGAYQERYDDPNTGDYLDYCVFFPENPTRNMPLIVYLHGDGSVGQPETLLKNPFYNSAQALYGDDFPFLLVAPCTRQKSWIADPIPETLAGLIDYCSDTYHSSKVIIVGFSRGSIGTWNIIGKYPEKFAAAVPVSCPPPWGWDVEAAAAVPVRAFSGDVGDDEAYYAERMETAVAELVDAGGDAKFAVLEGQAHRTMSSVVYTKELIEWMLAQ